MSGGASAKELLSAYNHKLYRAFSLNDDPTLSLPGISSVPWVGASKRKDIYKKIISHPHQSHHVKFITKNDEPHAFLWQTSAEQLKKAARWGIVKTHSITGKVISTLGNYRVAAHERVAKGMVSNSQAIKLKLLDLFQDRFEALQEVESLVNRNNTVEDFETVLNAYIAKLEVISTTIGFYFADVNLSGIDESTIDNIKSDLKADIARAKTYLAALKGKTDLRSFNRARGKDSILEFVKQQMIQGLYELQGINQDMTYSKKRFFAMTRGELNDFIEDARREIDEHQPDLRNAVTAKHHGQYAPNPHELISYDFSHDELTPDNERKILLAISFIEGWDQLENRKDKSAKVYNLHGEEVLDTITATRWQTHRNVRAFLLNAGFYILNSIKGMFVSTHKWEEETWKNTNFHLVAAELRAHAKPNEPIWRKPFKLLKQVAYAAMDMFNGVYDFGAELVIGMPTDIVADWESSKVLPLLDMTLATASKAIDAIHTVEKDRLTAILEQCAFDSKMTVSASTSTLARAEYTLGVGEQNDLLTAMARGLNGFSSVFTHNIYAKDPVAGLIFTTAYAIGVGAIYLPTLTSSIVGSGYVKWFSDVSYAMGSSEFAAMIAGSATQAEVFAVGWDGIMHGPNSMVMNALYQAGEDPLTVGAYFAAAYGLGYLLANGGIPWLGEYLKAELGANPEASYPVIGAKIAIMLYEVLITEAIEHHHPQGGLTSELIDEKAKARFKLANWLFLHAKELSKLDSKQLFAISRQIDELFSKEESKSLKKLLRPETHPSIAFLLLYMPLSYIPAILRVGVSLLLSLGAWVAGHPHPLAPVKQAATQLYDQAKKDLSRLLVFATQTAYLLYLIPTTFIKMGAYLLAMTVGRVGALFDAKPAHAFHRMFASVHNFFRSVGEFLYPVRALKDVAVAHPMHTINTMEASYAKLLTQMSTGQGVKAVEASLPSEVAHHAPPVFSMPVSPTAASTSISAASAPPAQPAVA